MDFSTDNIAELLGSLRDEDLQSLRNAAQSIFGGEDAPRDTSADGGMDDMGVDPQLLRKVMRAMQAMQSGRDDRSALIRALKPYLSAPRQKKADEAMQILRLIDILPMLQQS